MSGSCPRNGSLSATLRACLENTVIILERTSVTKCTLLVGLLLCCASAFAQSPDNVPKEVAVLELGGAAERSLTERNSSFGPTVAVEFTPIENWLELEAGVTRLFRRHSTAGAPTFSSKNLGLFPPKWSSCLALAPSGFTRTPTAKR